MPGTDERRTRRGFIGAGKLEEYSAGVVFRHEHTLSGPKADRLELLRHTRTHTGRLFYALHGRTAPHRHNPRGCRNCSAAPTVQDEYGVTHRLWVIWQPERVAAIQRAMADQKLVIADGHHRYETALNFRNEQRTEEGEIDPNAPHERAMMTFVNTRSEGLTILPTHRVVANLADFSWPTMRRYLEPFFAAESFTFAGDSAKSDARAKFLHQLIEARDQRAIGVYPTEEPGKRAFYVLTLRPGADLSLLLPSVSPLQRELDVVLLHDGILEPALGITPQAVTAEKNLTYERRGLRSSRCRRKGRGTGRLFAESVRSRSGHDHRHQR